MDDNSPAALVIEVGQILLVPDASPAATCAGSTPQGRLKAVASIREDWIELVDERGGWRTIEPRAALARATLHAPAYRPPPQTLRGTRQQVIRAGRVRMAALAHLARAVRQADAQGAGAPKLASCLERLERIDDAAWWVRHQRSTALDIQAAILSGSA